MDPDISRLLAMVADPGPTATPDHAHPDGADTDHSVLAEFLRAVRASGLEPARAEQVRRIGLSALAGDADIWGP